MLLAHAEIAKSVFEVLSMLLIIFCCTGVRIVLYLRTLLCQFDVSQALLFLALYFKAVIKGTYERGEDFWFRTVVPKASLNSERLVPYVEDYFDDNIPFVVPEDENEEVLKLFYQLDANAAPFFSDEVC